MNQDTDVETGNPKKRSSSKSETRSSKIEDELVLEDINDNDFVPDVILPSSCKLEHPSGFKDDKSQVAMTIPSASNPHLRGFAVLEDRSEVCGKLVKQTILL